MGNTTEKRNNQREIWIDLLRALAIFLVICGHTYNNKVFYQIVNPLKMPLFYFLAGFFLNLDRKFIDFIQGIAYRFIIPWIIFTLFPFYFLRSLISDGISEALHYAVQFLLGQNYWFITSFIMTQLMCYALYHLLRKNELITLFATVGCFFLGIALKDFIFMNLWTMDTALTGTLFVMLGKYCYSHKDILIEKYILNPLVFTLFLALYCILVGVTIYFYPGQTIDFHNTQYYNPIICLALIVTSISCSIFIVSKLKPCFVTKMIATMGQHTLVVYLLNGIVIAKITQIYTKLTSTEELSLIISIILTAIACALSTAVSVICGRYAPILIGKKRK